jgi:hypothetical protein
MTTETHLRLKLWDVLSVPEFAQLTERQQIFLARYLSGGAVNGTFDPADAAKTGYRVAPENAAVLAYEVLGGKRVKRILDLAFGRSPMDRLLEDLHTVIKRSLRRDARNGGLANADTTAALNFYTSEMAKTAAARKK